MMSDAICRECETVAHCTTHGCIPKQPRNTIDMARKAGFELAKVFVNGVLTNDTTTELKAFEALVRADEREECANICDELADKHCWEGGYANECAIAIRARGEIK